MKDSTSNNIFVDIVKQLQRQGKDKATHHAAISEQDHRKIKKSTAVEPDTPEGLVMKTLQEEAQWVSNNCLLPGLYYLVKG